jgi:hypothetical protein
VCIFVRSHLRRRTVPSTNSVSTGRRTQNPERTVSEVETSPSCRELLLSQSKIARPQPSEATHTESPQQPASRPQPLSPKLLNICRHQFPSIFSLSDAIAGRALFIAAAQVVAPAVDTKGRWKARLAHRVSHSETFLYFRNHALWRRR